MRRAESCVPSPAHTTHPSLSPQWRCAPVLMLMLHGAPRRPDDPASPRCGGGLPHAGRAQPGAGAQPHNTSMSGWRWRQGQGLQMHWPSAHAHTHTCTCTHSHTPAVAQAASPDARHARGVPRVPGPGARRDLWARPGPRAGGAVARAHRARVRLLQLRHERAQLARVLPARGAVQVGRRAGGGGWGVREESGGGARGRGGEGVRG